MSQPSRTITSEAGSPRSISTPVSHRPPKEDDPWGQVQYRVRKVAESFWFDLAVGVVILLSAVSMGIEQSLEMDSTGRMVFQIVDGICLGIYIVELAFRGVGLGKTCLRDGWFRFDAFLITTGIVAHWIVEPLLPDSQSISGPVMILRSLRLLRVVKIGRLFGKIRELSILIGGLLRCAPLVFYTFVVFLCSLYVFGYLGVEVIARHSLNEEDEEFRDYAQKYFGTLPRSLLTLLRFACLDNTSEVYLPLIEKEPWLAVYFVGLVFLVSLVLFHLLGAVVFTSTLDTNQREAEFDLRQQEAKWNKIIVGLRDMFMRMDMDQSGRLSKDEVMRINTDDMMVLCEALGVTRPIEVFNALDVDKSGEISIDEFFDGVRGLILGKGAEMSAKRTERQVETIHWRLKEMFSVQHEMSLQVQRLAKDVAGIRSNTQTQKSNNLFAPRLAPSSSAEISPASPGSVKHREGFRSEPVSSFNSPAAESRQNASALVQGDFLAVAQEMSDTLQASVDASLRQAQELLDRLRADVNNNLAQLGAEALKHQCTSPRHATGRPQKSSNHHISQSPAQPVASAAGYRKFTDQGGGPGSGLEKSAMSEGSVTALASTQQVKVPEIGD